MTLIKQSNGANPLIEWQLDPRAIKRIGKDLQRPECILAERNGTLWAADARGGVMRIEADGTQELIVQSANGHFDLNNNPEASLVSGTLPNGLAFDDNGDFLIANFGLDRLERMTREGAVTVIADTIDGAPIGKVNFVLKDSRSRIWLTVSTKLNPWSNSLNAGCDDGYIALLDKGHLRIVADGFRFTNEIKLDAKEEWLYVAETTGKRVSRLKVQPDGSLTDREVFGPSSLGDGLTDGITFDAYGNLWATMFLADRLIAITPQGDLLELLNDGDQAATAKFEKAFATGDPVPFDLMLECGGPTCCWLASVTFGGADLQTGYLGGLRSTDIPYFESPVAGLPLAHW